MQVQTILNRVTNYKPFVFEKVELDEAQGRMSLRVRVRARANGQPVCDGCGRRFATPEPGLFSFNSPLGACATCQGFGRTAEVDWNRVVPDPELSLADDAIVPFATPMGRALKRDLLAASFRQLILSVRFQAAACAIWGSIRFVPTNSISICRLESFVYFSTLISR